MSDSNPLSTYFGERLAAAGCLVPFWGLSASLAAAIGHAGYWFIRGEWASLSIRDLFLFYGCEKFRSPPVDYYYDCSFRVNQVLDQFHPHLADHAEGWLGPARLIDGAVDFLIDGNAIVVPIAFAMFISVLLGLLSAIILSSDSSYS